MPKYFRLLAFLLLVSCSSKKDQATINAYQDILPDLVEKDSFLQLNRISPPPPLSKEVIVEYDDGKPKEIHLLNKLLPLDPNSFAAAGIFEFESKQLFDSSWIGKIQNSHQSKKIKKLDLPIERAGKYYIRLIDEIPEPYELKANENITLFYLQLSDIIFNENQTKGVFYYAVAIDENANGTGGYAYIAKENAK